MPPPPPPKPFAGCLKAHRRALVVGHPTTGKATSHVLRPCEGGTAYITAGRCLLPGGLDIHGVGVTPDIRVGANEDPLHVAARSLDKA